jgi:hypothetical protein
VRVFAFVGEADAGMAAVASLVLVAPPLAMVWLNRRLVFAPEAGSRLEGSRLEGFFRRTASRMPAQPTANREP